MTFVVSENNLHHTNASLGDETFLLEIDQVYQEDLLLYDSSAFYVAICNDVIIGSVKITLWDGQTLLPMEKLFGIQCKDLPFANKLIWQVGRLAISKTKNPVGMNLLKQLLTLAIYHICLYPNSVMLAECDKKLLRVLNLLGIKTESLAPGIEYLGSETIPIYATSDWLKVFLQDNSYVELISTTVGIDTTLFDVLAQASLF